jgi:hypothetical protein
MKLQVKRVDVWMGQLDDRPGGLAEKLAALSATKANLEFVLARRSPERPGQAVVFLAPVKGARQDRAAASAGLGKAKNLFSVRVKGQDKPGLCACMIQAVASAGINLRGLSGMVIGRQFVV